MNIIMYSVHYHVKCTYNRPKTYMCKVHVI